MSDIGRDALAPLQSDDIDTLWIYSKHTTEFIAEPFFSVAL
jgi:hypothetical protein